MKTLKTLIKAHKRRVDELRRVVVRLEQQHTQLEQGREKLQQDLDSELVLAGENVEMSGFFGNFAERIRKKREALRQEMLKVQKQIQQQQEKVAEAFSELKKYEIALDLAEKREAEKQRKREQAELDELAGQQYIRKHEDV